LSVTIYHNPRCSKSRATLEIVQGKTDDADIVEYLKTPPSEEELKSILGMLGMKPAELLRKKEAKEAGVDPDGADDAALVAAMVANPAVIERPIVVANGKARIGRPPESVLEIL